MFFTYCFTIWAVLISTPPQKKKCYLLVHVIIWYLYLFLYRPHEIYNFLLANSQTILLMKVYVIHVLWVGKSIKQYLTSRVCRHHYQPSSNHDIITMKIYLYFTSNKSVWCCAKKVSSLVLRFLEMMMTTCWNCITKTEMKAVKCFILIERVIHLLLQFFIFSSNSQCCLLILIRLVRASGRIFSINLTGGVPV